MAHTPDTGSRRNRKPLFLRVLGAVVGLGLVGAAVTDAATSGTGNDARARLNLIAPAGAGGGWDSAARELQQTMKAQGIVNNPQVVNIPGAGGTIGLTQVAGMSGESSTLMVMGDRKSTRLNSSHSQISYAVFCLK